MSTEKKALLTKLTTGEEIIAEIIPMMARDIPIAMFKHPLLQTLVQTEEGIGYTYSPWLPQLEEAMVPVPVDSIMTQGRVNSEINDMWVEYSASVDAESNSGIIVPDTKIAL